MFYFFLFKATNHTNNACQPISHPTDSPTAIRLRLRSSLTRACQLRKKPRHCQHTLVGGNIQQCPTGIFCISLFRYIASSSKRYPWLTENRISATIWDGIPFLFMDLFLLETTVDSFAFGKVLTLQKTYLIQFSEIRSYKKFTESLSKSQSFLWV